MKFSVRVILFLILVIAIAISGLLGRYSQQKQAKVIVAECNGEFHYDQEKLDWGTWPIEARTPDKALQPNEGIIDRALGQIYGSEYSSVIRMIEIRPENHQLPKVKRLLGLARGLFGVEILRINGPEDLVLQTGHLTGISRLQNLRFLSISQAKLDRSFFSSLASVEDLEVLYLSHCEYQIEALEPLAASQNLAWVKLGRNDFDPQRLKAVQAKVPFTYLTPPIPDFERRW